MVDGDLFTHCLTSKLSLVNGVLFTGGSVKQAPYFETIKKVFRYVLDKNGAGVAFPLFARCLGFKLVSMTVSKANSSKLLLATFQKIEVRYIHY